MKWKQSELFVVIASQVRCRALYCEHLMGDERETHYHAMLRAVREVFLITLLDAVGFHGSFFLCFLLSDIFAPFNYELQAKLDCR
jgi:hypothetical protein